MINRYIHPLEGSTARSWPRHRPGTRTVPAIGAGSLLVLVNVLGLGQDLALDVDPPNV